MFSDEVSIPIQLCVLFPQVFMPDGATLVVATSNPVGVEHYMQVGLCVYVCVSDTRKKGNGFSESSSVSAVRTTGSGQLFELGFHICGAAHSA